MPGLPSVLVKVSTGEVLKYAAYPREDMQPIDGLDPDLEWLIRFEPYSAPQYDTRYYSLVTTDSITTEPHPVYTWLNTFQRTYSTVKKDDTVIQDAATGQESSANLQLMPIEKQVKYTMLTVGSILRQLDGQTTTPAEVTIRTKYLNLATKVWQNDSNLQAKIAEILLGNEPNLDDGWVTTE